MVRKVLPLEHLESFLVYRPRMGKERDIKERGWWREGERGGKGKCGGDRGGCVLGSRERG